MKNILFLAAGFTAALALSPSLKAQTAAITDWDFDAAGTQAAPDNSPAPTFGLGTASVLGMNNSYNSTTSLPYADVTASSGASTGSGSFGWRIRGGSVSGGAGTPNGWSSQAPIGTQGAEFDVSTAGFDDIEVTFDLDTTNQAERNLAVEYFNGSIWQDATVSSAGSIGTLATNTSSSSTINGSYVQLGNGWNNQITAFLPADAANIANFGIRIVNASTGADDKNVGNTAYNNTSGNWRYDNVEISGQAVPEPASYAILLLGGALLFVTSSKIRSAVRKA